MFKSVNIVSRKMLLQKSFYILDMSLQTSIAAKILGKRVGNALKSILV